MITNIFIGHFVSVLGELIKHIPIDLVVVEDKPINNDVLQICKKKNIRFKIITCFNDFQTITDEFNNIDLCFVASFSLILKKTFIDKCKYIINFHSGDIEICRGRHPLPSAILHGHKTMGLTAHLIDSESIDAGGVLAKVILPINYNADYKYNEKKLTYMLKPLTKMIIQDYLYNGKLVTYNWNRKKSNYYKPLERKILDDIFTSKTLKKHST